MGAAYRKANVESFLSAKLFSLFFVPFSVLICDYFCCCCFYNPYKIMYKQSKIGLQCLAVIVETASSYLAFSRINTRLSPTCTCNDGKCVLHGHQTIRAINQAAKFHNLMCLQSHLLPARGNLRHVQIMKISFCEGNGKCF